MSSGERFTLLIALITGIGLPILGYMIRIAVIWTRQADQLTTLTMNVKQLVADKDKTHKEMLARELQAHREIINQMREDRKATNERLTYLERFVWPAAGRRGRGD